MSTLGPNVSEDFRGGRQIRIQHRHNTETVAAWPEVETERFTPIDSRHRLAIDRERHETAATLVDDHHLQVARAPAFDMRSINDPLGWNYPESRGSWIPGESGAGDGER